MTRDYTLGVIKTNIYALGLVIPIFAIYTLLYQAFHGVSALNEIFVFFSSIPVFLISLLIGTILHELIHAVCWSWLDGIPWNKIHFGFKWKMLTPYVHCPEPVEVSNYRWGIAMPGILLGVLPFILSLIFQSGWLLGFGFLFTVVAGGDILILWMLRDVKAGKLIQDHPDKMGCRIINSH